MARVASTQNIVIEPVDLRWGNQERTCIDAVGGAALAGKYFEFQSIDANGDKTDYYCWYDDSVASDPAPAGKTAVPVVITGSETAAQIASATAAAIEALSDMNSIAQSDKIVIENKIMGEVSPAADVDTTFTFTQERQGSRLDLGFTEGDISLAVTESLVDVTTTQTGAEVVTRLRNGILIEGITVTLKEATAASLAEILKVPGKEVLPVGGAPGEEAVGVGGGKQFSNVNEDARKLVFHPTRLDESVYGEDIALWLAYPQLNGVNFSGESAKTIEVEFSAYIDEARLIDARNLLFGDHTKNYLRAF